jgi:hypothetical protein
LHTHFPLFCTQSCWHIPSCHIISIIQTWHFNGWILWMMHMCMYAYIQVMEVVKDGLSLIVYSKLWIRWITYLRIHFVSADVEPVCGCYYGQLWLFDKRFVHIGRSPLGRVCPNMGRVWPKCYVSISYIFLLLNWMLKWRETSFEYTIQ